MPPPLHSLAEELAYRAAAHARAAAPQAGNGGPLDPRYPNVAARPLGEQTAVVTPMGSLYEHIAPTATFQPFSYYDAKAPDRRAYDPTLSPARPFTFDVARYKVPQNMALVVLGYTFGASRFGGVDPLDTLPLEPGRLKTSWFWDLTVNAAHTERNTTFNLVPTPIVQDGAGNGLPQAVVAESFARVNARQAQAVGGGGLASLPFDGTMYGPERSPFTLNARQGEVVAIRCSIVRPLGIPLSEITGRIDGYLFPVTALERFERLIAPGR